LRSHKVGNIFVLDIFALLATLLKMKNKFSFLTSGYRDVTYHPTIHRSKLVNVINAPTQIYPHIFLLIFSLKIAKRKLKNIKIRSLFFITKN